MEESKLKEILDLIVDRHDYVIEQVTCETTTKWSEHYLCEGLEFLFSKNKEIQVLKKAESPSWLLKSDYQLSIARWLKNEIPQGQFWSADEQTIYCAQISIGKNKLDIVVILSMKLEVALDSKQYKVA